MQEKTAISEICRGKNDGELRTRQFSIIFWNIRGETANLLGDLVHGDLLAVLAHALELHLAVHQGEQGVVGALTHVGAGVDVAAALTNQNVAGQNELTVGTLHAQALGLGVTAVLGGAAALLVSEELDVDLQHKSLPSFLKAD